MLYEIRFSKNTPIVTVYVRSSAYQHHHHDDVGAAAGGDHQDCDTGVDHHVDIGVDHQCDDGHRDDVMDKGDSGCCCDCGSAESVHGDATTADKGLCRCKAFGAADILSAGAADDDDDDADDAADDLTKASSFICSTGKQLHTVHYARVDVA